MIAIDVFTKYPWAESSYVDEINFGKTSILPELACFNESFVPREYVKQRVTLRPARSPEVYNFSMTSVHLPNKMYDTRKCMQYAVRTIYQLEKHWRKKRYNSREIYGFWSERQIIPSELLNTPKQLITRLALVLGHATLPFPSPHGVNHLTIKRWCFFQ